MQLQFTAAQAAVTGGSASKVFLQSSFGACDAPASPSASRASNPSGVIVDAAGNLFIDDCNYNRVLMFKKGATTSGNGQSAAVVLGQPDFTSGGSGTAANQFRCPYGGTYDLTSGTLYVTETFGARFDGFLIGEGSSDDDDDDGTSGAAQLSSVVFTSIRELVF